MFLKVLFNINNIITAVHIYNLTVITATTN